MVDRLDRLRHDTVVRRDHEHHDVRGLGAARAHEREGLVARRIEKGDGPSLNFDAVGADVLGDPAGFLLGDVRLPDRIQQRRLAVVHVAHHGHDRRTTDVVLGLVLDLLPSFRFLLERDDFRPVSELGADLLGDIDVECLVDRGNDPFGKKLPDDELGLDVHLLGELFQGHALGDRDRLEFLGADWRPRELDDPGDPLHRGFGLSRVSCA